MVRIANVHETFGHQVRKPDMQSAAERKRHAQRRGTKKEAASIEPNRMQKKSQTLRIRLKLPVRCVKLGLFLGGPRWHCAMPGMYDDTMSLSSTQPEGRRRNMFLFMRARVGKRVAFEVASCVCRLEVRANPLFKSKSFYSSWLRSSGLSFTAPLS